MIPTWSQVVQQVFAVGCVCQPWTCTREGCAFQSRRFPLMKTPRPWLSLWSCPPSPSQHFRDGKAYDHSLTAIHNSPYTLLHTQSTHPSNVTLSLYVSPGLSSPPCRFDLVAEVRVAPSNVSQPCGIIYEPCVFPCEHNRDTCEATLEVCLGLPNGQSPNRTNARPASGICPNSWRATPEVTSTTSDSHWCLSIYIILN